MPGAHTIPSATISATCHVFAKNSSCSPRGPWPLAPRHCGHFVYIRSILLPTKHGNEQNIFQTFLTQTCACLCHSCTPYGCVCAAHQIKQSQRTAVSCTATKETKNKFALRANEHSAGGRQNHREGSEEEGAGQLIHLSRAPAPAARLCVSLSYAFPGETRVCS